MISAQLLDLLFVNVKREHTNIATPWLPQMLSPTL